MALNGLGMKSLSSSLGQDTGYWMCGPYGQFLRYVGESTSDPLTQVLSGGDRGGRHGSRRVLAVGSEPEMSGNFYRRWEALGISENEDLACS